MKRLGTGLLTAGLFLSLTGSVWAKEGVARLGFENNKNGSCFAVSIYVEDRFRVLMSCRGLQSALDPVRNKYVVWTVNGQNPKRLGEIQDGKMQASSDGEFDGLEITAEKDAYSNKPKGEVLLSGKVEEIGFDRALREELDDGVGVAKELSASPTPVVEKISSTGSVFKVLGKALLTGFLVLLGVVGVLSYVSRWKK